MIPKGIIQVMQEFIQTTYSLLGIELSKTQIDALTYYENELINWNKKFNLTTIKDPEKIRIKHFLDSFTCSLEFNNNYCDSIIDVGTGAGFPGIPLKIVYPKIKLTLVESVGKKVEFCKHVIHKIGLNNVDVIHSRAETLGQNPEYRQKFRCAVSRAVAVMPTLVEYILPLLVVNGVMIAMKGPDAPAEAHEAEYATSLLGGHLRKLRRITLPGVAEDRYLVVIDKVAATPEKYPRRIGIPRKRPLKTG